MPMISEDDYKFLTGFRSVDGFGCDCAPGEIHEIEATDWQRIAGILEFLLDGDTDK